MQYIHINRITNNANDIEMNCMFCSYFVFNLVNIYGTLVQTWIYLKD